MNADQYQLVQGIFGHAIQLSGDRRREYLDEACRGDSTLRMQVEELLTHDESPIEFVQGALVGGGAEVLAREISQIEMPPSRVGHYQIRCAIGKGGMGVVYEAQQDNPSRLVALKIVRPELATPELLRRFHHEVQILGSLQHPGIAAIYEAGSIKVGDCDRPFFAMEFVAGEPLLSHCRSNELSTKDRLRLFVEVCDAVDHAHEHGIVHRDLKPDNILVERHSGRAKVLDFGVARATDLESKTLLTTAGQIVGTLTYMSPEQASGESAQIDARSDVYSLGVILYELLCGQSPHSVHGKPVHEAVRIIQHDEQPRLGSVNGACRGDLETIVAKALEKDRLRRYQSAGELAADIRRYLADRPILARPASALYRVQKLCKRRKPLLVTVASAAAVGMVVIAGAVAVAHSGRKRAAELEEVVLSVGRPGESTSPDVRLIWSADDWMAANPDAEAYAFDQFYPGVDVKRDVFPLVDGPTNRPALVLVGGTMTISSFTADGRSVCPIRDASALAKVSDAWMEQRGGKLVFDFDPPITAFYCMFGNLARFATTSETLFARGRLVAVTTSARSVHDHFSQGHGFVSSVPIDRIEVTTTDNGSVVIGALRDINPGESGLGTVRIPGYGGPNGDDVYLDFACAFAKSPG